MEVDAYPRERHLGKGIGDQTFCGFCELSETRQGENAEIAQKRNENMFFASGGPFWGYLGILMAFSGPLWGRLVAILRF